MIVSGNISGETQTLSTGIYTAILNGDDNSLFILTLSSIFLALFSIIIFNIIRRNQKALNFYE